MRLKKLSAIALLTLSTLAGTALARDSATVKGVVYDSDHKAVSRATVRLLHREKGERKLVETDTVTTDSDGAFKFKDVDDGTYVIVAASRDRELRDRSEITVHDGRDPEALSFTIRPGREDREEAAAARSDKSDRARGHVNFVGQVVDRSGDPVKNAKVRLLTGDNDADTDKLSVVDTVETDGKGRFEFYKVAFGNYVVDASKGGDRAKETVRLKDTDGTQSVQLKLK